MSLLYTLKRWIDSNEFREEEADRKRWQTLVVKGEPGDNRGDGSGAGPQPPIWEGSCRLCGTVARQAWCPRCLAYTVSGPPHRR